MKLGHYLFQKPIDFESSKVQRLVFENPSDMGLLLKEFSDQSKGYEGSFILVDSAEELNIRMNVRMVIDPFSINLNSKEILDGFYRRLTEYAECSERFIETNQILNMVSNHVISLASEFETEIEVGELFVKNLLKDLSLGLIGGGSLSETVSEYSRLVFEYTKIRLLVFVNLQSFLSEEDYKICVKQFLYLQIPVLLIESRFPGDSIPTKIFDLDFCEFDS